MTDITIANCGIVHDAGGEHYDFRMTSGRLVELVQAGRVKLEGNIRYQDRKADGTVKIKPKTSAKIKSWSKEYLDGEMTVGNLSLRLKPDADFDITTSTRNPDFDDITLKDGVHLDTAVDSESRIRAILLAHSKNPTLFNDERLLSFRLFIADDPKAHEVAARYNTEGENVNSSTSKSAWAKTPDEKLAKWLYEKSGIQALGKVNVETLADSVSKNSPKAVAFNTLTLALRQTWTDKPMDDLTVQKQGKYIADIWKLLVEVRPEYGTTSLSDRQKYRSESMAGTALSYYGAFAVIDQLWTDGTSVADAKAVIDKLAAAPSSDPNGDWLSRENPIWLTDGIIVRKVNKSGAVTFPTRNNFQSRSAVAELFLERVSGK